MGIIQEMETIPFDVLQQYRQRTFRSAPGMCLTTKEEAIAYVNERGFIYFWPIKTITLPSLWAAVAGDRPVADAHDDPGHISWGWKDSLLGAKAWYYAKVLRQKATIISLETAPYFYALSENYGSPEEDYLTLYRYGRLSLEAKNIYEVLLEKGALDTVGLRKAARLTSAESDGRFNKALSDLQSHFFILPVGVTDAGAWHYAFAYDLVTRHFPNLVDQARFVQEKQARAHLANLYFLGVGAAQLRDLTRLFGWTIQHATQAVTQLIESRLLQGPLSLQNNPGEWYATQTILFNQKGDIHVQ